MDKCDMCGSKIEDNKCPCGVWKTNEEMKENPYKIKFLVGLCDFCKLETQVFKAKMTKFTHPIIEEIDVTMCEKCYYFNTPVNSLLKITHN